MNEYINIKDKTPNENGIYDVIFISNEGVRFNEILMFKDGDFYDSDPDWNLEKVSYGNDLLASAPSIKAVSWKKLRDLDALDLI